MKCFFYFSILIFSYVAYSQSIADTSKIIVKKFSNIAPHNYNISDISVKKDPIGSNNFFFRIEMDIPAVSKIFVNVTDSAGIDILYLLREKTVAPGSYFIKWEMYNFPEGKYWCEFNTPDFIYRKDFYIHNGMK
jgi:hypothetical protein